MTEVERTGLSTLIQSKKEKWRSIRASRKRKLHEVYCVATQVDALPTVDSIADDSQPTTAEESRFHDDNAVLQGPFLNEHNLPPRRIPPLDVPTPHDTGRGPVANDASSACLKQAPEGGVTPTPNPLGPRLPQPADLIEQRDASPGTPSGAPPAASLPTVVPSLRTDHGDLAQKLDAAQTLDRVLPDRLSQSGATVAEDVVTSSSSQGPAGREVAFAEPVEQLADSDHAPGVAQHPTDGQHSAEDGQHAPDPDAMDLDETPGRPGEPPRLTSSRPPPLDASRPPDVLSSPGSTAQTATTPAVHEASPDTSPDNEGPQYPGDDEDLGHQTTAKDTFDIPEAGLGEDGSAAGSREPGVSPASAQLLSESANVPLPTKSHTPLSPADGNGPHPSAQVAAPTRPVTDEVAAGSESDPEKITAESQPTVQSPHTSHQHEASRGALAPSPVGNDVYLGTGSSVELTDQQTSGPSTSMVSLEDAVMQSKAQQTAITDISPSTPIGGTDLPGGLSGLQHQEEAVADALLRTRSLAEQHGLKHKRAPTVVFAKRAKKPNETTVASQPQGRYRIPTDDYFVPLFFDGFTRQSNWMKSPEQLLGNTHKTLSSPDCNIVLQENQACKVLRRIYHLQQNDKWSLRQPKRCPEPTRQPSHWDLLLQEMKWMRTDFREERKWKRAIARKLSKACAEWVASSEEDRKLLQVNAKTPPLAKFPSTTKEASHHTAEADSLPTPMPDLVPSDDADSPMDVDDEPQDWNLQTVAPSAIFALQDDEVVFGLQRSPASDQLLDELPFYSEPLKAPQPDLVTPEYDPDARWRRPALPLSKYVEGQMVLKPPGPRLQQSRFKYALEDEDDDFEVAGAQERDERTNLPPENTDVALFRPEMKMIRDRLHAGVKFRPPTESLMPLQSFYENRTASVWTSEQDDELRKEVREHSYNWSLISQIISSKSLFVSAEDRRTPWECFERWVQLEGFPNDVARTQYFQTYQRRIDSAQRAIAQANENARPQVGPNGTVTPAQRRRSTLPYRVDRRNPKRHFAIIDAMKKLAKKREAAVAKQQQTANNQNRRTSNDNPQQKLPTKTPEDYSRLRHEREKQMHEKLMRFTQQQEAQRQAALQGRAPNQMGRVSATPGTAQVAQNAAAAHVTGMANPLAARLAGQVQVPGQTRPRMPIQQQQAALAAQMAAGGLVPPMPVNMNGMTQAQQLAVLQAGQRMQLPDANLVMQARRIQDQQRRQQAAQQQAQAQAQGHHHPQQQQGPPQQQAQQMPSQHSPPQVQAQPVQQPQQNHSMPNGSAAQANSPIIRNGMNGINQNNFMMNNMTAYAPNGMGMATSPGGVGMNMQSVPAGSPSPGFTQPRGLPPSMQAHFAEFENQIRMQNPDQSPAAIRQTALVRYQQLLSRATMAKNSVVQNAMDAAAGSPSQQQAQANGIANASSPQQYAQLLRQQQLQQQQGQHTPQQVAQHQQQQAIAQAAAARQVSQQHQRQPSGGATPVQGR